MKKDKCKLCSGSGEYSYDLCPVCGGAGKVDWIEQIVGVRENKFKSIECKQIVDDAYKRMREATNMVQRHINTSTTPNKSAIEEFVRSEMRQANIGDLRVLVYKVDKKRSLEIRAEFNLLDERYGISVLCPMH